MLKMYVCEYLHFAQNWCGMILLLLDCWWIHDQLMLLLWDVVVDDSSYGYP